MKDQATVAEVIEALHKVPQDATVHWGCDGLVYIESDAGYLAELNLDQWRRRLLKVHSLGAGFLVD